MQRKHKGIIGGIIILIILIIALFLLLGKSTDDKTLEDQENGGTGDQPFISQETIQEIIAPIEVDQTPVDPTERYIRQRAKDFTVRFRSFSTNNKNKHIDDALVYVTNSMAIWVDTNRLEESAEYKEVTTNVISTKIESVTNAKAIVTVGIQETDELGVVLQRHARVELEKRGNNWLVNGFFFQ